MVIDLGELRHAPEAADSPPPPRRRRWRGFAALGAAAAMLAAGGAAPVRSGLIEATIPGPVSETYFSDGIDGVFVVSGNTIAKYAVAGARLRWRVRVPVPLDGPLRGVFTVGRTVLVTAVGARPQTAALDAETGRLRWDHPGWIGQSGDDHVLLGDQQLGDATLRYTSVELTTGRARWTVTVPTEVTTHHDEDRFVRFWPSGRAEVRDVRTGQVVATGAVPPPAPEIPGGERLLSVQVVAGLVLVARRRDDRPVVDAYGLDGLQRRWTAQIDLAREHVSDCGDAICVGQTTGAPGVRLVERDTGRTRWSDDRWMGLTAIGPALLAHGATANAPYTAILDPEDGRERAALDQWELGWPMRGGRTLAVRNASSGNQTWIAEVDLSAGTTRILGLARDASACQATVIVVTCRRQGGSFGIWYPRRRLNE